ncbi:hypothetical protein Nhal_1866 [Nitrosococcus halophilus Nc 4]|uniref:Uncharacterized protein n=1 Tax=Nitrosococcus halophilus (strain Nc4) TaxID=472759 RepID=D5C389_NITHN|nr:hypothetical protein Nhal_1866 [Nitrosococcus halophilus Nc 4]
MLSSYPETLNNASIFKHELFTRWVPKCKHIISESWALPPRTKVQGLRACASLGGLIGEKARAQRRQCRATL